MSTKNTQSQSQLQSQLQLEPVVFLHFITDYGVGDPAFGEVIQRLKALDPQLNTFIYPTAVPSFNTIATGFWIYQYALGHSSQSGLRMVIYSNTAPRKESAEAMVNNSGEKFLYGLLDNGVEILAVNAGYCFSFVKPYLKVLKVVDVANMGSQFRSRDFYPQAVSAILNHKTDSLLESVSLAVIPDVPKNRIGWIDGYGNIKTTIRKSELRQPIGSKLAVSIDGITRTALVAGGSFSVREGELALSAGSSGYDDPFLELFLRGGSAQALFNQCPMGSHLEVDLR